MKIKWMMLITMVLLATLIIGAVSAGDASDFNETLTVDNVEEVSLGTSFNNDSTTSFNDNLISEGDSGVGQSQNDGQSGNDEQYRDADYFVYISGDEFNFVVDDNSNVATIILKPNTTEGRFVISDGDLKLFDENITNKTSFFVNGDGSLKYNVRLCDLNLTGVNSDDEITFMFYDGNGDEVEIYTVYSKIRVTDAAIQFYSEEDSTSNFIYVSHLEFSTDKNSSDYSASYIIGGIVLDPYVTSGRFVGLDGNKTIFSKEVDLNNGWHKDTFNNIKCHLILRDLNLTDVNDGDDIIFTFYDGEGREVENFRKIMKIHLTNSSLQFYEPFSYWIDNFESISNYWAKLCEFFFDERVEDAVISLTVMFDENNVTFNKTVEDHGVSWQVNEIFDEYGIYNISLAYSNGKQTFNLVKNHKFQLTQLDVNELNQDVCVNYPYDVLRIYDNEAIVEVYVNGDKRECGGANPFTWTLNDFNIIHSGDYEITILSYDEENHLIENITYNLNVIDFDDSDFKVFTWAFEVLDLKEPVVHIYCPEGSEGNITIEINGNPLDSKSVTPGEWMNYTLDDLGIENNGDYEIAVYNNDNQISQNSINVWRIITNDSFNCLISSHEYWEETSSDLCSIWFADYINEGTLTLSIRKSDGTLVTDDVNIEDIEGRDVRWRLEDFDIFDETGLYTVNLTYTNEDGTIYLAENHPFTLTLLSYGTCENVHIYYPFDVIRFFNQRLDGEGEYVSIEVTVNGNLYDWSGENPYRWKLEDLGIVEVGEYEITIKTSDNGNPVDEFTYTLNVDNDTSNFRIISDDLGVEYWEVKNPVIYIISPDENIGDTVTLTVNDNSVAFEINSTLMNWTLNDLGIDTNDGYDIRLLNDNDDEMSSAWLNVRGIITKDSFNWWISSHEYQDNYDNDFCNVWFNDNVFAGTLILSIEKSDGSIQFYDVDLDGFDVQWRLEDLDIIDETGRYTVNLTYQLEDKLISLAENHAFTLTQLSYDTCEDVHVAYPFDVIRFCNQKIDDEGEYAIIEVSVNGYPVEWGGVKPFRWTLKDLGITEAGQYDITVKTSDDKGLIEEFTYTLNVYNDTSSITIFSNGLGVRYWEVKNPALYLVSPEENIGDHLTLTVNGNPIDVNVTSTLMNWTLGELGIDCNEGYDIQLFDEDDNEIASTGLNVEGFITEENFGSDFFTHSNKDNLDNEVVHVWVDDNVGEGIIYVYVKKFDGTIKTYNQSIEDSEIVWILEDLDILDETGIYYFDVIFKYDDVRIVLVENRTFYLTQMNLEAFNGEVYINYPFDIVRIINLANDDEDNEKFTVKVYVNDNPEASSPYKNNPMRWTLKDLGISEIGENTIAIRLYEDDDVIETLTFNINVYDEFDELKLISDNLGVKYWGMFDPILYLLSPQEYINKNYTLKINDEEYEVNINSTLMNWTLNDFAIKDDEGFEVQIVDDEYNELASTFFDVRCFEDIRIKVELDEEKTIFTDSQEAVIYMKSHNIPAIVYITVNNETIFKSRIVTDHELKYAWTLDGYNNDDVVEMDYEYVWDLKSLGITDEGDYNITVKVVSMFEERTYEGILHVETFNNDAFRAKSLDDDDYTYLYFFAPTGSTGNISVFFYDDSGEADVHSHQINESFWNKWIMIGDDISRFEGDIVVKVNGEEIPIEIWVFMESGNGFEINNVELNSNDTALWVYVNSTDSNCTINITAGGYTFIKKVVELGDYEWWNGVYRYPIFLEDLDSFSSVDDRQEIKITLHGADLPKGTRLAPIIVHLKKADGVIQLVKYGELRIDVVKIQLMDDGDDSYLRYDIHNLTASCVKITIPDYLNITDSAEITVVRDNYIFTKKLTEFTSMGYDYECLGNIYYLSLADLNIETLKNHEVINISLISNGEIIGNKSIISYFEDDDTVGFEYFQSQIELIFHYGEIGNTEFGQGDSDGNLIVLTIPKYLNITEGTIKITADNGTVLYSKSLSEFGDNFTYEEDLDVYKYLISDSKTEFDYTCIPQGVNFTVSFTYENTTVLGCRGVRIGDILHRINTPNDVEGLFKITIEDRILCDGEDNVITIAATDHANRMSIYIDVGGGYFTVYVNGVKVDDLGRLIRVDDETELELFRLFSNSGGNAKLKLYLSDLNITENGIYEIRIAHIPEVDEFTFSLPFETELFNQNITLTSNVKSNYHNSSIEWLTGYGLDPDLLYLDTYYGEIDEVTGIINVLNDDGDVILTSNIKDLPLKDGRRYLKYSDFSDNFKDKITIRYSDGNERNGETTLDVLWRNVTSEDFTPDVKADVEDYYANFLALNIPDLIDEGQIIVTIKFKNNKYTNISDMNVTKDFDSQAVYRFNIADIKANYGNDFALSLFDLNFFEDNGDYELDVKFTADNINMLNITSNSVNVEFLKDVVIKINETSRYGMALPFASVKIFEPINAYAELYIDGKLYSHRPFEKGMVIFDSSPNWAPGNHFAEIKVFNSEFGSLLNSSNRTFETLTKTDDVTVYIGNNFTEKENATIAINVPENGTVYIQIDRGNTVNYTVGAGNNTIDLGVLSQGNHTIWIMYENENGTSYYNNYITIFVGDDGSWVDFPDKIILNDDDTIKINLGEGSEGYVLIYIDDKLVANRTLVNGSTEISLTQYLTGDNVYGVHNYTIIYYDRDGNLIFSKNGTFTVAYIFRDNIDENGVPLQEYYVLIVNLPPDATGYVRITVNNYTDTQPVVNGQAVFIIEGLPMGEYDVLVEYLGDDKYPASSYHTLMNVSYYGVVGDFLDGKRIISLLLPENATGNLVIYNDNMKTELYSIPLVNGKASVDLSRLSVGIYDIRAYYDGEDYEVRQYTDSFKVMPKVIISQDTVIGENLTIYVDLDNSTGSLLIVLDGLSPALVELVKGKVNYTFSTENYTKGNHTATFYYIGNSFDGHLFYELDEKTGYFVPIEYDFEIHPIKVIPKTITDNDEYIEFRIYDENGNFMSEASGFVDVTFIDRATGQYKSIVLEVIYGIARMSTADLKDGDYEVILKYLGDKKCGDITIQQLLSIKHKLPKIIADNIIMEYTSAKAYSVTVYKKDGSIANGVAVSFAINNQPYGNVVTNSKGVATIKISKTPGTYTISSTAMGITVNKQLKVNKILSLKTAKVKRSAKKLVLQATLKKVDGKYLKGKKITFKFNGKKYTAKTNKKGVAKVTIKKKVLKKLKKGKKVKYQVSYLKETVKKTAKVKK